MKLLPPPLLAPRLSRKPSATPPDPRATSTWRKPSVALTLPPRASRHARLFELAGAVDVSVTPPSPQDVVTKLSFCQPAVLLSHDGEASASSADPTGTGGLG